MKKKFLEHCLGNESCKLQCTNLIYSAFYENWKPKTKKLIVTLEMWFLDHLLL